MSLKEQIEALNKKYYIAQERLSQSTKKLQELELELINKYKMSKKILDDPTKLKQFLMKQKQSIIAAEETIMAEAKALDARITIT